MQLQFDKVKWEYGIMKKVGGRAIRIVNDNQVACSCVSHKVSLCLPACLPPFGSGSRALVC